jgi:beta-glucanase (GH16 family)
VHKVKPRPKPKPTAKATSPAARPAGATAVTSSATRSATSSSTSTSSTHTTAPPAGCGGTAAPQKANGSYWVCSFDDEFSGTSLDRGKWAVQTTAASNFGADTKTCFLDDPNAVSVSGGTLHLTARRLAQPITCASPKGAFSAAYTSGTVNGFGKFSQTYGLFQVRAKLPATAVKGLQETLWLWPVDQFRYGAWPLSGEIDFAEFYSQYAGWAIPYLHYGYDPGTTSWTTNTNVVTAYPAPYAQPGMNCRIDQSGFNTYTLLWEPGRLTIQVNGQNCIVDNYRASGADGAAPFDQPFFLALTQAIGQGGNAPTASTPFPATTEVDYVRVWK